MSNYAFPVYQVKVAGHVVEQVLTEATAMQVARSAAAKPVQVWRIQATGHAELLWAQS